MTTIEVKGVIVMNDYKEIYDWYGIENTSPNEVIAQLPEDGSPIEVIINSGGGHVDAGVEMYTRLKEYSGEVTTKVYSMAASAASIIAMGGDKIIMSPPSQLMIHNVSGMSDGDYRVHEHEAKVLQGYNKAIANAYVLRTGKTEEEILQLMNDETYLTSQQAIELGFADEIMFENKTQFVASAHLMLSNKAIEKARTAMKQSSTATSVEGYITKADFEAFKNEITTLLNKQKEDPTPTPQIAASKRRVLF